jgi:putative membrane protein
MPQTTGSHCDGGPVSPLAAVFVGLAAALHVVFFLLESVLWTRPPVRRRFRLSAEHAEIVRPMAFNQGFYNLFLAVGAVVGIVTSSVPMAAFACAVMAGAAVVLVATDRAFLPAAAVQGVPPAVALVLLAA